MLADRYSGLKLACHLWLSPTLVHFYFANFFARFIRRFLRPALTANRASIFSDSRFSVLFSEVTSGVQRPLKTSDFVAHLLLLPHLAPRVMHTRRFL